MKAKITKPGNKIKVPCNSLSDGDWFLDEDQNLCMKYDHDDEYDHIDFSDPLTPRAGTLESVLVTPVQVTISY